MSTASSAKARRTAARLAAVQALYQLELGEGPAPRAVYDLMQMRQDDLPETLVEPDAELLKVISEGVGSRQDSIDDLLGAALADSRPLDKSEAILRAVLRAGTFELLSDSATATGIIINDYVNVAHAFFSAGEPAKVNAVLNAVARALGRGNESAASARA